MSPITTLAGRVTKGMGQRTGYFCSDRWKHGDLEHDELSRHSRTDLPYTAVPKINRKLLKNICMGKGSIKTYWAY